MTRWTRSLLLGTSILSMPLMADVARAQSQTPGTVGGIQEIVVTAQRREQALLSVPLAITAISGSELNATGITEISSLQFNTPGFLPENGTGYTQIYIRGIGNNIFVGADPSVVTNIDDVPRIYGSMVNSLVNVDRVEVLKGAQGGLYGRNATGGVVNVITRQPSDEFHVEGKISYGEKNTLDAAGYVNVPVTDKVEVNFAAERKSHDPYVKNLEGSNPLTAAMFPDGGGPVLAAAGIVTPAQTAAFFNSAIKASSGYGDENFWAVDGKALFKISDNFKVTFDGDDSRKHDSEGNQWFGATPAYSQAITAAILGEFGITTAFPANFFPTVTQKFTTYNSTPADAYLDDYGGSVKADLTLPSFDIIDITAYRAQQTLYEQNYADPITLDVPIVDNKKWYVYEEVRAVSNGSGPLQYIVGGTYLRDHFHGNTFNELLPPLYTVPIPSVAAATDTFVESFDDVRDWSLYAQLGYDFLDHFNLTVSGRYIHETNHSQFVEPVSSTTLVGKKFVPAATVSYKLDNGGNIYARYANGWKAGGVNPVVPPTLFPSSYGLIFGPEKVNTYEVGAKTPLFDRDVQLSTAVFYNDYKDLQTTTTGNPSNPDIILAIVNAGNARTYGAEEELTWRVISPVTLGINTSYLNAKYINFQNTNGAVLDVFNFSHQQMLYSPEWQLSFTADLDQPLNDKLHLIGNLLVSHITDIRAGLSATPGVPSPIIPAYWLTNLRIGVRTADERYTFSVYANNLFNAAYYTFGSTSSLGNQFVWGDPRIVGGELDVKF